MRPADPGDGAARQAAPAPPTPSGDPPPRGGPRGVADVGRVFLRLGLTSFGGPVAHLGYLRAEIVDRRRWLDDGRFAELVALCQLLPGPASSQLVFALGMHRAGVLGAVAASAAFTLPSAVAMIAFAYALTDVGDLRGAGWLHGLRLVAVPVVVQAVWAMGRRLCAGPVHALLCLAATAASLAAGGARAQVAILAGSALAGVVLFREPVAAADRPRVPAWSGVTSVGAQRAGVAALAAFALLLGALPAAAALTGDRALGVLGTLYRAGALVFGGGHVVHPLLHAELVPAGWVDPARFLAGYGAAQAVPGPLFTFAGFLGASMPGLGPRWSWGIACLGALLLPGWLLVGGALPVWGRVSGAAGVRAAVSGANVGVVGVLLAALADPVIAESVTGVLDVVLCAVGFALLERGRVPPWLLVGAFASAGAAGLLGP